MPLQWIRIFINHFNDPVNRAINSLPEADLVHYIQLQCILIAGQCNDGGRIWLTPDMPFCPETFAEVVLRPINKVTYAVSMLTKFGRIETTDFQNLKITNWNQYLVFANKEREMARIRQRKCRQNKRQILLPGTPGVTPKVTPMSRDQNVTCNGDVTLFDYNKTPFTNDLQFNVTHVTSLEEKRIEVTRRQASALPSISPTSFSQGFRPSPAANEILYRIRHSFGSLSPTEIKICKQHALHTTELDWKWIEQNAEKRWSDLIAEIRKSSPDPLPKVAADAAENPDGSAIASPLPETPKPVDGADSGEGKNKLSMKKTK